MKNNLGNLKYVKFVVVPIIFLMVILLIPIVSAEVFTFDNRVVYDESNPLNVEIKNTLGFETLGTLELKSHTSIDEVRKLGAGENQAVMYYDFSGWEYYEDGLGEVIFVDMKTGEEIQKDYYFAEFIYEQKPTYEIVCNDKFYSNETKYKECSQVQSGYKQVSVWKELELNDIPNRNTRIGLITDVEVGDYIDAVWTIAGKKIKKHSSWTADLNVDITSYWKLDEATASYPVFDSLKLNNGSNTGATNITGLIKSAYNFSDLGDIINFGNSSVYYFAGNDFSISLWIYPVTTGTEEFFMALAENDSSGTFIMKRTATGDFDILLANPTLWTTLSSGLNLPINEWSNVILVRSGSVITTYRNAEMGVNETGVGVLTTYTNAELKLGTFSATASNFLGIIDEVGIWNRSLTYAEVVQLNNSGAGISYTDDFGVIEVILNSPEDNFNSSISTITFNTTVTDDIKVQNVSLLINGIIDQTNTSNFNGTYIFLKSLESGLHNWSILAFDNDSNSVQSETRFFNITIISPTINLYEPLDNLQTINTTLNFTGDVTDDFEIVNVSLFINGVLNETNFTGLKDVNYTFENITFAQGDYTWFYRAFDNDSNPSDSVTRSFTVHLTNPDIVITEPSGVIGSFVLGNNLNLNWSIEEIGVNLSAHISNCSYLYDGVETFISIATCVEVNSTTFLYVDGVNSLNFTVIDIFNLSSTNTTSWSFAFLEGNRSFNGNVSETSSQEFQINLTTDIDVLSISAVLTYNGTNHTSTASCDGGNCSINNILDVPLAINGDEFSLFGFFWQLSIFNGTDSISITTSERQQNVSRIHLEECAGIFNTTALNFTAYDEQNLTRIVPFLFDGTFNQWLGTGIVKRESNFTNSSIDEFNLCISPNSTYFIDAIIEYDEAGNESIYTLRNYFFQNDTISNQSQDVFLYLLKSDVDTSFILKVQDDSLLPISNALIEINRFYPGTNEFRIVQIARTDDLGKSIGFFETEIVDYKFNITQFNSVLLETGIQKVVPEVSPFTLTFTVGDPLGEPWAGQEELEELNSSLVWNDTSGIVTYVYIDTSGNFTKATLLVMKDSLINISADTIICNESSTLISATLTCTVGSSDGFYIASGIINRDAGDQLDKQISFQIETLSGIVGLLGLFFGWFLILISAFMFKFNDIAGIWGMTITVFLINLTGLIKFGNVFTIGLIGVAIILTWVIESK